MMSKHETAAPLKQLEFYGVTTSEQYSTGLLSLLSMSSLYFYLVSFLLRSCLVKH